MLPVLTPRSYRSATDGAWLHCDEVYRMLEHEPGATPPSVADLYERGVSTGSMSKSYSLAGLRTGWVAGPPDLIERCLEAVSYTHLRAHETRHDLVCRLLLEK